MTAPRPVMGRWFEDLTPGTVIDHAVTRTITEADNTLFSVLTMNAQPLHLDESFAETTESMQTLQLSGYTEEDIAPLLQLMEFVGRTVPDSYGELVVLEGDRPDLVSAVRYRLTDGRMSRL